jgi:hypothetical protein
MVKKWKQAKGTAQEVGSAGKHLQFRNDPSGNPRDRPRGFQIFSTYLVKAARRQLYGTKRFRSYKQRLLARAGYR